ncbi:hypothetical protein AVEN_170865-1, partial [Araneus ventricosus]
VEENNAAEISRRMNRVYGTNFVRNGAVREWYRKLKDCQNVAHGEAGRGHMLAKTLFSNFTKWLETEMEVTFSF